MENKNEPTTQITIYTYNICYISFITEINFEKFFKFLGEKLQFLIYLLEYFILLHHCSTIVDSSHKLISARQWHNHKILCKLLRTKGKNFLLKLSYVWLLLITINISVLLPRYLNVVGWRHFHFSSWAFLDFCVWVLLYTNLIQSVSHIWIVQLFKVLEYIWPSWSCLYCFLDCW